MKQLQKMIQFNQAVDVGIKCEKRNKRMAIALSMLTGIISGMGVVWSHMTTDWFMEMYSRDLNGCYHSFQSLTSMNQSKCIVLIASTISLIVSIVLTIYIGCKKISKQSVIDQYYHSEIERFKKNEQAKNLEVATKKHIEQADSEQAKRERIRTDTICEKCWPDMPGRNKFLDLIKYHGFVLKSEITDDNFSDKLQRLAADFKTRYEAVINNKSISLASYNELNISLLFESDGCDLDSCSLLYMTRFNNAQHDNVILNMIRLDTKKERVILHLMDYLLNGKNCFPADRLLDTTYLCEKWNR